MGYAQVRASIQRRIEWAQTLKDRPCERCGKQDLPEQMHWHHRDPETKSFKISVGVHRNSRKQILEEIAKCDLLCRDCHWAAHYGEGFRDCGTVRAYKRGCRCDDCRAANAAQTARYRHRYR